MNNNPAHNCNILGAYANGIFSCLDPNTTVCIFRYLDSDEIANSDFTEDELAEGTPTEDYYYGAASGLPDLRKYRVVDIQYDSVETYGLFIEVEPLY